jgi:hypothetical protein
MREKQMSNEINQGADWEQSKRLLLHWHQMWAKEVEKNTALLADAQRLAGALHDIRYNFKMSEEDRMDKAGDAFAKWRKKYGDGK